MSGQTVLDGDMGFAPAKAPVLSNEEVEGYATIYRASEAMRLMSFENFLRVALILRRNHVG